MARIRLLPLLIGGAVMAPLFAFGHGMEFLVAKLETAEGQVKLEITADYGANPMIADEPSAREAITNILRVGEQPLEALAPIKFERRQAWDAAMPAPQEGNNHELLTGVWRWEPDVAEVRFAVPKGSPNDVLLWTPADRLPGKEVRWSMLIAGDTAPPIMVKRDSQWWLWIAPAALGVALMAWLIRRWLPR